MTYVWAAFDTSPQVSQRGAVVALQDKTALQPAALGLGEFLLNAAWSMRCCARDKAIDGGTVPELGSQYLFNADMLAAEVGPLYAQQLPQLQSLARTLRCGNTIVLEISN